MVSILIPMMQYRCKTRLF